MLGYFGGFWDTWYAYHKVTFDYENRYILINEGVTSLNVKTDIYSDWKEWVLFSEHTNSGYSEAVSTVGGDPISATEKLGDTYFLENGWKIKPWNGHSSIDIVGNIYTRDGSRPIIKDDLGVDAVSLTRSTLTTAIIVDTSATDSDAPTWDGAEGITNAYQNGSAINISWGKASDANPISYTIYVSKFSNNVFDSSSLLDTDAGYFYSIRGIDNEPLVDGTTYYIGVRAIDIYGNETTNTNYASVSYAQTTVLDEATLHTALDNYGNKANWKADPETVADSVWSIELPISSTPDVKMTAEDILLGNPDSTVTKILATDLVDQVVTATSEIGYTTDIANNQIVQLDKNGNELARFDCFNESGQRTLSDIKTMVLAT